MFKNADAPVTLPVNAIEGTFFVWLHFITLFFIMRNKTWEES